jgi:hypothetical protein
MNEYVEVLTLLLKDLKPMRNKLKKEIKKKK